MNKAWGPARFLKLTGLIGLVVCVALFVGVYFLIGSQINNKATINRLALRPAAGKYDGYDQELISGIKRESFFIDCPDGSKLHCWFYRVPGAAKVAIVNHGNAGNLANRMYLAKALTQFSMSVLLYDYRGYGVSSGSPSTDGILQDGLCAFDYVNKSLKYAPEQIILYGESIGTAVTVYVASHRPCAGIILQSPLASLPQVGRSLLPILWLYPDPVFAEPHLNNIEGIRSVKVPVLILHGERDEIIPFDHAKQIFASANEPKTLILLPHCGHNDMGLQDCALYNSALKSFLGSLK